MNRPWKIAKFLVVATLMVGIFGVAVAPVTAAPPTTTPSTISFQGKIVNFSDGTNVADGTYSVTFKLYNALSGGSQVWGETQSLAVTGGVFQANLGSTCSFFTTQTCSGFSNTAIDFSTGPSLYLTMKFAADSQETSPRIPLQSVPFAFNAETANKVGGLTAAQLVQLSPGSAQTGFININGGNTLINATGSSDTTIGGSSGLLTLGGASAGAIAIQSAGAISLTGGANSTLNVGANSLAITSSNLTVVGATGVMTLGGSTPTVTAASNVNLTVQSQGTGELVLGTGSTGIVTLASSVTTLQSSLTALSVDLNNASPATLTLKNTNAAGGSVANLNLLDGALQTNSVTRVDNSGNLTNIGTVGAGSGTFNVNANGDITGAFVTLTGSTTTTSSSGALGASSTSLAVSSATNFVIGNYAGVAGSCTGGICYAKITNIVGNTLTISPALVWANAAAVTHYHIPELGGTNTAQPLSGRYGRGYFISGVVTGNGTTYYNEDSISSSLSTFNILNDSASTAATINIGNASTTTINIGTSGTTTQIAGALATTNASISAGTGQLSGGTLDLSSGNFAVNNAGLITAGSANTSLLTAGTLGVGRGGTGSATTPTNGQLLIGNGTGYTAAALGVTGLQATTGSGTLALAVLYGSGANNAAAGANTFTCTSASGSNFTATAGATVTLGTSGTSCGAITFSATPSFTSASATTLTATTHTSTGALTLSSAASGDLNITSSSGIVNLNATSIVTNNTSETFDLKGAGANALIVRNTGVGTADLTLMNGGLIFNATQVITSARVLQNVTTDISILTSGTLAVGRGGTGSAATPSNGQLLIGNGTGFTAASLGLTGIQATTGAGSLALAVLYGNGANNAAAGANTFTCNSGTGQLSGGGTTVTLGTSGTSCGAISLSATPSVTSLTATGSTTGLVVSGAPAPGTGITSLIQVGSAISGGNTAVSGGTYLGINTPVSGAGSAADFVNFQNNGTSRFKVMGAAGYGVMQLGAKGTTGNDSAQCAGASDVGKIYVNGTDKTVMACTATGVWEQLDNSQAARETVAGNITLSTSQQAFNTITITPSVIGNEIWVTSTFNLALNCTGLGCAQPSINVTLYRGTCGSGTQVGQTETYTGGLTANGSFSVSFVDTTLNTTSATTYNMCAIQTVGSGTLTRTLNKRVMVGYELSKDLGADYAEVYYSATGDIPAGTIVSVDPSLAAGVQSSVRAYQKGLIGVVSTKPGQVLSDGTNSGTPVILGLAGRVPVKVTTQNGPIKAGDYITSSSQAGVGMRATKAGPIVGVALHDFNDDGIGKVLVYMSPGEANGSLPTKLDGSIQDGNQLLFDLMHGSAAPTETTDISSIFTDHIAASIDVVAPMIISDKLQTNSIVVSDQGINFTDTNGKVIAMIDAEGAFRQASAPAPSQPAAVAPSPSQPAETSSDNEEFNMSDASTTGGLQVMGDLDVAGLSTFQKLATFLAKVVFRQDVEFQGHITVAKDSAGYAILRKDETKVHVSFKTEYAVAPVVNTNTVDGQFIQSAVSNITTKGFDISIAAPATQETKFAWTAVGVNDVQTASNPQSAETVAP